MVVTDIVLVPDYHHGNEVRAILAAGGSFVPAAGVLALEPLAKTVFVLTLGRDWGATTLVVGNLVGSEQVRAAGHRRGRVVPSLRAKGLALTAVELAHLARNRRAGEEIALAAS